MTHLNYTKFKDQIFDIDSENTFYKGDLPCVIDFYTSWCNPCKDVEKWLQQLNLEYGNRIQFYKIDCEKEKELAEKLNVSSFPHIMLMKNNQAPKSLIGLYSYNYIKEVLHNEFL